jgi:CRISPR/Cas system CSM-associated protein Csm2 small subunit
LKTAVESVLEHHFNNHSLCGTWCKVKGLHRKEREDAMLKYRSEVKNAFFYLQVKELFEQFYQLLKEMLHECDTNIVEGMNTFFCKFLPKDRTYVMTIKNKVRLYLAILIDSVGYTEVYRRLGKMSGLTICQINEQFNLQMDNKKSYKRQYRKQMTTKIRWMRNFYKKLTDSKNKLATDNRKDLQYSSGMVGPFQEDK